MFGGKKNSWRVFARVSLAFALACGAGVLASAAIARPRSNRDAADPAASSKRQSASAQFAKAEEQQAALNAKPSEKRTLADYKQVVLSYRRVAMITPRAPEVPDSLMAIAEIYTEMGDRFGRSYYQSAVDTYEFLVHEYPTNKYCQEAMLRAAKLQRDQLADMAQAQKTYEGFLKRYRRSPRRKEAQEALGELALLRNGEERSAKNDEAANSPALRTAAAEPARPSAPTHSGGKAVTSANSADVPRVRRIRAEANGEFTRVTIDLENSVEYTSKRIANPDRIFFDLRAARLTPDVARENVHVDGSLLTAVRVGQNHSDVVRVVLDVNGVKDYTASLISNPVQLVIDLYGNSMAEPVRTASTKQGQKTAAEEPIQKERPSSGGAGQGVNARNSGSDVAAAAEPPSSATSKGPISGPI